MNRADLQFLRAVPYFHGLSSEELARVHARCRFRDLAAGEIIVLEGQRAEALYIVLTGRVHIFKISAEGKEQVLFVHGPGATFDDVAVFDGGPALGSAQALVAGTRLYVAPAALIADLLGTNSRFAANVVRTLPGLVRQLTALVEDLSFRPITHRVARLLLEENVATGAVALTTQQMAARVGTVREAVSRALHQLEASGTITRRRDMSVQVHMPALSTYLGAGPPSLEA